MSRYSKIRKELVDNIKQQVRFGESKHEAKKQAIREARENGERFTAIQGNLQLHDAELLYRRNGAVCPLGGDKIQLQGREFCQAIRPQLPERQYRPSSQRMDDTHKGVCAGLRFSMSCA